MELYKITEEINFNFYRIPKDLLKKGLSHTAILLYGLLLDRMELSIKNNWTNEKGEVFQYFTREDAAGALSTSLPTVRKAFRELITHHLIYEKRQGQNKPNKIFVAKVPMVQRKEKKLPTEKEELPANSKDLSPEQKKSFLPDRKNLSPNDTDINYPELNYPDSSIMVSTSELTRSLSSLTNELCLKAWEYFKAAYKFYSEYRQGKTEEHPYYKPEQLEKCFSVLGDFIEEYDLDYDELRGMVNKYFTNGFKNCDYRFSHFCTEGILKNRMFEQQRDC